MLEILDDNKKMIGHLMRVLHAQADSQKIFFGNDLNPQSSAAVLVLLGPAAPEKKNAAGPCLILNKRSRKVRQPGDLCFPGGSITPRLDAFLARLFSLPVASLGRWPYWPQWKRNHPRAARMLALLWATGLRESLEEMRLNPLAAKFLGPMPPQNLVMFKRKIFPMVAWVQCQKRFFPNWEVEKILSVPLRDLLNPTNYRRYRLQMQFPDGGNPAERTRDYPCFRLHNNHAAEVLWGATFRIAMVLMEYAFGFKPPDLQSLPIVEGKLDQTYLL